MQIIIASKRKPKVQGVQRAMEKIAAKFGINISTVTYDTVEVESGVSDTPMTIEELMRGARTRASEAFMKHPGGAAFSIGAEGGLFTIDQSVFLQSWSCVFDGKIFHYGSSGAIEIPQSLSKEVIGNGIELSKAIDAFADRTDIRSNQGTFGILTSDLVTREDSFEMSTIFALMPFFQTNAYSDRVLRQ